MGSNLTIRTDIENLHSVGKKRSRVRLIMWAKIDELETDEIFGIGRHPSFRDKIYI